MNNTLLLLMGIFSLFSCSKKIKPPLEETTQNTSPIEEIAEKHIGQPYQLDYNSTKQYVCISKNIKIRPNGVFTTLRFVIYDLKKEKILYNESIPKARGEWIDEYQFKVTSIPGRVNTNNPSQKNEKIFDVRISLKTEYK